MWTVCFDPEILVLRRCWLKLNLDLKSRLKTVPETLLGTKKLVLAIVLSEKLKKWYKYWTRQYNLD